MHDEASAGDPLASWNAVDLRVGRITRAALHPASRQPAFQLWIDLGPLGERQSSAQLTERYQADDLVGRLVVVVVSLPPRRVAGFRSDVLVLGVPDDGGRVVLLTPDAETPPGGKVY